ncbi:MAG: hypothetical protein BRC54_11225, partial [Cyanobacteria bacterium SW_7_48_12]
AWGFSLLRESLESTELNPDTFPDLKTAQRAFFGIAHPYLELILYITGLPKGRGLRPTIFGHLVTVFAEQTYWFRRSLPPSLPVHS